MIDFAETNSEKQNKHGNAVGKYGAEPNRRRSVRHDIGYKSVVASMWGSGGRVAIGQIENISMGGFILKSETPLVIDELYRLEISLLDSTGKTSVIKCCATSVWGKGSDNPGKQYWTGFEFFEYLDISQVEKKVIELMIE